MATPEQIVKQITEGIVEVIKAREVAAISGMNNLKADTVERIFQRGEATDGSAIGGYSTKPIYVPVKKNSQYKSSGLKPRGKEKGSRAAAKTSKTKLVTRRYRGDEEEFTNTTKEERKSMYMPGGYLEFREVVGRETNTVNLNLTGQTQQELGSPTVRNGLPSIEFVNDKTVEIAAGNEEHFGKTIFAVPEQEIDTFVGNVLDAQEQAFFKSFGV